MGVPTSRFCFDSKIKIKDALSSWVVKTMNVESGRLPVEARVFGAGSSKLDLGSTLSAARKLLPILNGRPTITVFWPPEKADPLPGKGAAPSLKETVKTPAVQASKENEKQAQMDIAKT